MSYTALSLSQTPPLAVPLRYMLTAPLFAVAAGIVLFFFPEALMSRWTPATLAVTHLLTLGFLAMIMMGALQQLLPVLAGSTIPRAQFFSTIPHAGLTLGTMTLATGMGTGNVILLQTGLMLLGLTVTLFVAVAGWALLHARSAHSTVWAMGTALLSLVITLLLAGGLLIDFGWRVPLAHPLTNLHLVWGLVGWVAALLIGVAWQVVPMFQLTPEYPRTMRLFLVPLLLLGLVVWSGARLFNYVGDVLFVPVMALLITFAVVTLGIQHRRRRRLKDVTLLFWRTAMVALIVAMGLLMVPGDHALLMGVILIIGFASSAVNGMLYKIVPFLVWLHLNNRLQQGGCPQGNVPNMKQVIAEKGQRRHFWLHLIALAVLMAATFWPGVLARAAGAALVMSSMLLWWNMVQGARLYRRVLHGTAV